ncbi:vesicle-associated protein 1-3 isoform X1 [Selaginella moellendorffii]|uniref:vesicle-associated protein 1-3 isoform X1 n=1 Tax=Selaginella moellendorffii TaxID=88036 RepID=UPI000D1C3597|nr:vesicle-associated protein 1-3 isoform X1 [Selaginella moellendorffii]|eukprot:XP_002974200.2 vesicle-associated protein 1-3 isoform X1 [Selaginella moellendorffii]
MPELITVQPSELVFRFELKKQLSCSIRLNNVGDEFVAFKVKTTAPKRYCVRPNAGVIQPRGTCDVAFTMQAQREAPADFQCKDKFMILSVVATEQTTVDDIQSKMFTKEDSQGICDIKLKVVYLPGDSAPSPAASKEPLAGKQAQQDQRKLDPRSPASKGSTSGRTSSALSSSRVRLSIVLLIAVALIGVLVAYAMNNNNNNNYYNF